METLLHPEIYSCLVFKFESAMDKTVEKNQKKKQRNKQKTVYLDVAYLGLFNL